MAEISDEFKVIIVDAVRSLCLKFPSKHSSMLTFLSGVLRDEGTIQSLALPATRTARFLKLVWKSEYSGQNLGSLAEVSIVPAD